MKFLSLPHIIALVKKELRIYFNSPIAYVFLFFFLVIVSWLFMRTFFIGKEARMQLFFDLIPWIFLFFISAVTMRLFSEEKKTGTIEILMTLPVRDYEVVIGKFAASFLFLFLTLLLSFPIPLLLLVVGNPDIGQIIGSYIGALMLGASFLSIGIFVSCFTKNQIVAFILAVVVSFILFIIGTPLVITSLPSFLAPLFDYIGLASHYESVSRGVIDSRDIFYFISIVVLFLYFSTKGLETKKYR